MSEYPKAILFGSIGTLIESSEMQRESFNEAFREFGLDWTWENEPYREMLKESGGRDRIAQFAEANGIELDAAAVHARKTEIFNQKLLQSGASLRPGVAEIVGFAKANDIKLGFVSTTGPENISTMMKAIEPDLSEMDFSVVTSRANVEDGKPSPEIYYHALGELGLSTRDCIAIEDSSPSLQSSASAGVPTIAFPGYNCQNQDYSRAQTVIRDALSVEALQQTASKAS